uniref:GATA transcription factor 1 n=1 Tax=Physcomitrium patens TaxID=3218 RepID=A0A2K8GMG3_PHYPA|nr:GATA transcription factor 1 [Physcomitrium patens]
MEEPSYCNLSLAVDCTLSLGSSTTLRTGGGGSIIPARLSRAGSPDHDLTWSLAVRSGRTCEPAEPAEQAMSWGGSSDVVSPDYYPQVDDAVKAWPRTSSTHSYKDVESVKTSKALFSMIKSSQSYGSHRSSRQPGWLSSYIPSTHVVDVKEGDSFVRVCAHCGTSKTPLWRNGPGGPKSLCNACGIRFKKAGRRSAANGDLQLSPPTTPKAVKRKSEAQYWGIPKPRKRSRGSETVSSITWQSCVLTPKSTDDPQESSKSDDLSLHMGSYSSDEEEGAVLLMALSCAA